MVFIAPWVDYFGIAHCWWGPCAPSQTAVRNQSNTTTPNVQREIQRGQEAAKPSPGQGCTQISISIPAINNDKPATYSVTVKDNQFGLIEALQACNPRAEVAGFVPNSTKSARIKVTQGLDQLAYFKVPSDRADRILIAVYFNTPVWKGEPFWTAGGPLGQRRNIVLVAAKVPEGEVIVHER